MFDTDLKTVIIVNATPIHSNSSAHYQIVVGVLFILPKGMGMNDTTNHSGQANESFCRANHFIRWVVFVRLILP